MTTTAATYRRISADREGRELGIERQAEDLDQLAGRLGVQLAADYVDNDLGASTRSRKPRPAYRQMLDDARAGKFAVILAYTSGRLTRRPREHEDLIELAEQHGIRFEYLKSPSFDLNTAAGRRIARILAATDAGEAEDIAERVGRACEQRARMGLNKGGRRCFGYDRLGMELVPEEAEQIRHMASQLLAGVPLGAIARDLNRRGVRTASDNAWIPGGVRTLLMSPRVAGLSEHRGQIVGKAQWPAILTEDQHAALTALLREPSRRTTTGNRAAYLLSGLARCGACGGSMAAAMVRSSASAPPRYIYRCRRNGCVGRRRDWLDQFVTDLVVARLSQPDARETLLEHRTPDAAGLRSQAQALRVRLDELADVFAAGEIDRSQLTRGTEKLRAKLAEVEGALAGSARVPVLGDLVGADNVRVAWDGLGLDRRRAVIAALLTVTVHRGGMGHRHFDPTHIEITWRGEASEATQPSAAHVRKVSE